MNPVFFFFAFPFTAIPSVHNLFSWAVGEGGARAVVIFFAFPLSLLESPLLFLVKFFYPPPLVITWKQGYVRVAWQSRCSNVCISRIFRLQKRAARVILNRETQAPTLPLFNKLKWLPLYTDTLISKCAILFKRIQLSVPDYPIEALKLNSSLHSRSNRFSTF